MTNSLQNEEDKANRLSKLKNKLEGQLAEQHDELEKSKRLHAELDKNKRKVDADLKVCADNNSQCFFYIYRYTCIVLYYS